MTYRVFPQGQTVGVPVTMFQRWWLKYRFRNVNLNTSFVFTISRIEEVLLNLEIIVYDICKLIMMIFITIIII